MPVGTAALFKAAVMLAEVEEMQVTVVNTLASSAAAAVAGTGGFLILGPLGIAIGATLAGLGAYRYNKNKFKPVFVILKEDLRPHQQQELLDLLREAFKDLDHMDFVKLSMCIMNNRELWAQMRDLLVVWATEYFMKALSVNNVKVEVKQMTDMERYQRFTEEFKRQHGLPGAACPPAIGMRASGTDPAAVPGWRSDLAATTTGLTPAPETSAISDLPGPDDLPSFDEVKHLPTVPETTVKTTFDPSN